MVSLQAIVVHLCVTFIADSMQCVISSGKLPPLVTASFAYGTTAALAVLLCVTVDNLQFARELGFTDHARLCVQHPDVFQVVNVR